METLRTRWLLELPEELLAELLVHLAEDGVALARMSQTCRALYPVDAVDWRNAVLHRWGWLLCCKPTSCSWRQLFVRLHTRRRTRFCVVGGAGPPIAAPSAALSLGADGRWSKLTPPPGGARNMAGVVRGADGELLVIGGVDERGATLDTCARRQFSNVARSGCTVVDGPDAWVAAPSLSCARCCAGAAVDARARTWAVGGGESMYSTARAWQSVEVLQPSAETWREGPPLLEPRCALGLGVCHATERLFACGGYAGCATLQYLDTAEMLAIGGGGDGRWQPLPRMSCRRAGPNACMGPDGRLYVVGGGPDGRAHHTTVEALDARVKAWDTALARCRVGRHYNAAGFSPEGLLLVAGAFRHDGQLLDVEAYDCRADKWQTLPSMPTPLQFGGGAWVF